MVKKSLVSLAVVAVGSVVFSMPAMAALVSIANHSFETHNLFTNSSPIGNFNFSIVGWQATGTAGTFEPSTPGNSFGNDVFTQDVPDGFNTAFNNNSSSPIWQVLTTTLAADTTYNLSVEVGNRLDFSLGLHSLELHAGGTILDSASASPSIGEFATASLTYSTAVGAPIGSALEIWLVNNGGGDQVNWDNVQLDAVAAVPAPSAMLLFGSGLAGLVFWRMRGKQTASARS
jgi:hypothetical protein